MATQTRVGAGSGHSLQWIMNHPNVRGHNGPPDNPPPPQGGGGHGGGGGGQGGGGGGGGGGGNHPPKWNQHDQDALSMLQALFSSYGLGGNDIVQWLKARILDGDSITAIQAEIQTQDFWKQRFWGNELLKKQGLNVLSVSQYLATESAMTAALHNSGFPSGFWDDPKDLAKMIGAQLSAAEVQQRATWWSDLVNREDPQVVEELRRRGIGQGDLAAYLMDPDRAMPLLAKKYNSTLIGAAAERVGMMASVDYADTLAARGITEDQAQAGYGQIASILPTLDTLADIYGEKYNQHTAERDIFESNADAASKRKLLVGQEQASFAGQSGVSQGSLSKPSAGSY